MLSGTGILSLIIGFQLKQPYIVETDGGRSSYDPVLGVSSVFRLPSGRFMGKGFLANVEGSNVKRTKTRLIVVLALLFLPCTGWSASFKCDQAQTDTEWAICNTPELSALDKKLAATYHELSGPKAPSPEIRKKAEQMQTAWLHGRRDLCGGDVFCVMTAYQDILSALQNLPYTDPASIIAKEEKKSIVPRCNDPSDPMKAAVQEQSFAEVVCSDRSLLDSVRRIEAKARQLQPRLTPALRSTFDAQEAAFPTLAYQCPSDGKALHQCVARAIEQRLQDLSDLTRSLDKPPTGCNLKDLSIKDSGVTDAGMSKTFNAYWLEYKGTEPCRIRGYPAIAVSSGDGRPLPTNVNAIYSGSTYYSSSVKGAPLPVTLSPQNNQAWFGIETATACDPIPGGLNVKVGLRLSPESLVWLGTLKFPYATCPVTVTPINMISTLRSSVK